MTTTGSPSTSSRFSARTFLVHGLLAGLLAGLAAFLVGHQVGEPQIDTAIALEESAAPASDEEAAGHSHSDSHSDDEAGHSHGDEAGGTEVSRATQKTWGLATGTVAVGLALGGILGLLSGAVLGRLGRLGPAQSTATVVAIGFVSFSLVPFLKYPAAPPAVGSGDTIGERTGYYFVFLLVSVLLAVALTAVAVRLAPQVGAFAAVAGALVGYAVLTAIAGGLMPTVNEVGDFPADTLWYFRLSSLYTLAALWGVIGLLLTGLVARTARQQRAEQERRELAASL